MSSSKPASGRSGKWALVAAAAACLAGCGQFRQPEQVLDPHSFVATAPPVGVSRGEGAGNPLDRPSDMYDSMHMELLDQGASDNLDPGQVSQIIQDQVRPPSQAVAESVVGASATQPGTQPAGTQPALAVNGDVTGQYQVVGSVLAEVNGKPVYADQVLRALDKVLKAEARQYDADQFRAHAVDLIDRQVHEFVDAELEFAAADHNLNQKDKDLVKDKATEWRQQQIAQAGGSVEMAKRHASDEGQDFEDEVNQHYRLLMTQLYYQRHISPLIRISPRDMRQYYDAHLKDYTQYAAAKFRVIQIDADSAGSVDAASKQIEEVRQKALAGDDFAKLAAAYDQDPSLGANGGYPVPGGWVDQGAYSVVKVEDAVWKLQPGEITVPIQQDNSFYIAKLEDLKQGKVDPFESETIQDTIRNKLWRTQFTALRDTEQTKLENDAILTINPDMIDLSLDMVMQQYPDWVAKK